MLPHVLLILVTPEERLLNDLWQVGNQKLVALGAIDLAAVGG